MKKNRKKRKKNGVVQVEKPRPSHDPLLRAIVPIGRSGYAIAAGYLGLVSVLLIPAPFALVVALVAIRDLAQNKEKHGWGRTLFGLVMGGVFTALLIVLFSNR